MYEGGLLGMREGEILWSGRLPFAQVAVLGRIHEGIIIAGHMWSLPGNAAQKRHTTMMPHFPRWLHPVLQRAVPSYPTALDQRLDMRYIYGA
jgi:hypothetical protein